MKMKNEKEVKKETKKEETKKEAQDEIDKTLMKIDKILKEDKVEIFVIALTKDTKASFLYSGEEHKLFPTAKLASTMANRIQGEVNKDIAKGF